MKKIYIITGPAGVGKTTISKELANRLDKVALIEGDDIYNMIIKPELKPWKEPNHLNIFWKNVYSLIDNYLDEGFDVVFNYIIKQKTLEKIIERYSDRDDIKIIFKCLIVDKEELVKRDLLRPEDCRMGERSIVLLNEFLNQPFEKYFLDTTYLTIEDTVNRILE